MVLQEASPLKGPSPPYRQHLCYRDHTHTDTCTLWYTHTHTHLESNIQTEWHTLHLKKKLRNILTHFLSFMTHDASCNYMHPLTKWSCFCSNNWTYCVYFLYSIHFPWLLVSFTPCWVTRASPFGPPFHHVKCKWCIVLIRWKNMSNPPSMHHF